jgi:hypothetical protein
MQSQHSFLIPEQALSIVAQLAYVLSIQEEVAVLWCLPSPRTEQFIDDMLVSTLMTCINTPRLVRGRSSSLLLQEDENNLRILILCT